MRQQTTLTEQFFSFWSHYLSVPAEARRFIESHAQLRPYKKGEVFSQPEESRLFWCFVLEGLVAGLYYEATEQPQINWLAIPFSYFTGTTHLFTTKPQRVFIEFLKPSKLLMLPREIALSGQQSFPAISELFHILKQQQINRLRKQVALFAQKDYYSRYQFFMQELPDLAYHLPKEHQPHYLQISRSAFYKIQRQYLTAPRTKK